MCVQKREREIMRERLESHFCRQTDHHHHDDDNEVIERDNVDDEPPDDDEVDDDVRAQIFLLLCKISPINDVTQFQIFFDTRLRLKYRSLRNIVITSMTPPLRTLT